MYGLARVELGQDSADENALIRLAEPVGESQHLEFEMVLEDSGISLERRELLT